MRSVPPRLRVRSPLSGSSLFVEAQHPRWLDGNDIPPEEGHDKVHNAGWRYLKTGDVISMPDRRLEVPLVRLQGPDGSGLCQRTARTHPFQQLFPPQGQIPVYEWVFDDVNPPVHAFTVLEIFRMEREWEGKSATGFLHRVFNKLLLNYA